MQTQELLVTEGATLVTKGIALEDNLVAKESADDSGPSSKQLDESSNSGNDLDVEKILVEMVAFGIEYVDIGPSYDSDTVFEINDLHNKLLKIGQTAQTFHMLLPKDDNVNTRKKGLGFKIQNNVENPFILNKAKELTPSLYNIAEMGKDLLSDHKIISEEELKCETEKRLKVKQRKSLISYHGFVYGETQFKEPPKVPLKRRNVNLKSHLEQAQLRNYDPNL
ncbi:hypothetical protein Tco_1342566 [Tanacetum coccineum]